MQVTLCVLLANEMLTSNDEASGESILALYPTSGGVVAARFVCGIILHMMLQNEMFGGMNNMKIALSHPYRFRHPRVAFFAGFL